MKILKKILILTIGVFLVACEDVIIVDLDTAAPRLVIDASIDWVKNSVGNEQKVILSTTTGYYSNEFPTVLGANITVVNSLGVIFNFTEETPNTGEYACSNFEPVIGETYTLTIALNGETYTATETLMATPVIEDTFEQNNAEGFGTLDSQTLETVISSLETLQAQGKMIGIISHVENLKERIPAQIKVLKKSNGVSEVELV